MSKHPRPKIDTKLTVDSYYSSANERIVEISHNGVGCLVSARVMDDGKLLVQVYRADPEVIIPLPGRVDNGLAHDPAWLSAVTTGLDQFDRVSLERIIYELGAIIRRCRLAGQQPGRRSDERDHSRAEQARTGSTGRKPGAYRRRRIGRER
jgi:hypothetical protein